MAQTFSFPNVDFEIEQQIITAGTSTRIRKKTLPDPTYDLKASMVAALNKAHTKLVTWNRKVIDQIALGKQTHCRRHVEIAVELYILTNDSVQPKAKLVENAASLIICRESLSRSKA